MTFETIYIKTSIWKTVPMALGCFAFVVVGLYMYNTSDDWFDRAIGVVCIVFFGVGSLFLIYQAIDRRARIVIDAEGITDRTLRVGKIEWSDIVGTELRSVHGTNFVELRLADKKKYMKRLTKTGRFGARNNRAVGFGDFNLNLSLIDISPEEVYNIVNEKLVEGGRDKRG